MAEKQLQSNQPNKSQNKVVVDAFVDSVLNICTTKEFVQEHNGVFLLPEDGKKLQEVETKLTSVKRKIGYYQRLKKKLRDGSKDIRKKRNMRDSITRTINCKVFGAVPSHIVSEILDNEIGREPDDLKSLLSRVEKSLGKLGSMKIADISDTESEHDDDDKPILQPKSSKRKQPLEFTTDGNAKKTKKMRTLKAIPTTVFGDIEDIESDEGTKM